MSRFQLVNAALDRRNAFRYDVRVDAVIASDSAPNLACTIRDISQTGALIRSESDPLPDQFTLVFSRQCHVTRRSKDGKKVGVEFLLPWSVGS